MTRLTLPHHILPTQFFQVASRVLQLFVPLTSCRLRRRQNRELIFDPSYDISAVSVGGGILNKKSKWME